MKTPELIVDEQYQAVLAAHQLDSFEKIMTLPAMKMVRSVPGRSTVRVELSPLVGYLKRYEESYLTPRRCWLRIGHWPGADDEAAREWRKILVLRQHGFLTAAPIALGQRRRCGVVVASFLLQQEIRGGVPADEYLLQQPAARRRRLLGEIGRLARRLREAGFIHKDLYLKHIFVVERGGAWDLHLIDLQRVLGPRPHRERWYLKDAAALAFSVRTHAHGSRTDLLRLYKGYAPGRTDKQFIRRVWPRVERLLQRKPKYKRVWNQ